MKTKNITSKATAAIVNLRNQFNKGMDRSSELCLAIEQEQYEATPSNSNIREWMDELTDLFTEAKEMNMEFAR
jgi:hypothetical protein